MNSLFVLVCLATLVTLVVASESNYCKLICIDSVVSYSKDNAVCEKNKGVGSQCVDGGIFNISDIGIYRDKIVHMHNKFRDQIAGGVPNKFPIAAHMLTMQWDEGLAAVALYNTKDCLGEVTNCNKTANFIHPKFNELFSFTDDWETKPTLNQLIEKAFSEWATDSNNLIASDKTMAVGCSGVISKERSYLRCYYGISSDLPKTGEPIYKVGSTPAEDCTGKNNLYNNLCVQADTDREYTLL